MEIKQVANLQTVQQLNSQTASSVKAVQTLEGAKDLKSQEKEDKISRSEETFKNSPHHLEKIVEELEKKLSLLNTQLQIQVDKDTDILVVKVIDKQTKKVIRQIPPDYLLRIAKYLDEITGLLLREKA